MPMLAVTLRPGVDTQQTLTLNSAGVSQSQLIRYKENLIQTYGGWVNYIPSTLPSTTRDLHPWEATDGDKFLSAGGTTSLSVVTSSGFINQVTPLTYLSSFTPSFSCSTSSSLVTVFDPNSGAIAGTIAYFNTQASVGGLLLSGAKQISTVLSTGSYQIDGGGISSVAVSSGGALPIFATSSGSASVLVTLSNNNYIVQPGLFYNFIAPTSVGGLTIQGRYPIASIVDSTSFKIFSDIQASSAATVTMNGGLAQILYYQYTGINPPGSGFGVGGFGNGGFGTGSSAVSTVTGTPITSSDWTQDNWGEALLACPEDGPIYIWADNLGAATANAIANAPFFNGGIFISMPQQILVAWRSCQTTGAQDPLLVKWSDSANYNTWTISNQTAAGAFHIPTGSQIIGGMQCPTFGLISTDLDVWVMQYVGGTVIFNFSRIGTGCGWLSKHSCGILAGQPYWIGTNNFFTLGGNGVVPMPCTVWDAVFQNINKNFYRRVTCAVNSAFNEISWFYPSAASTGECDSYVKVHIEGQEYQWDYGSLARTAWTDVSVLGTPISVDTSGFIYQHEIGDVITGASLPTFRSGWWAITEGQDLSFVDWVLPDFQWGQRSLSPSAQINITFFSLDYPGDTPKVYGPYTVTQATQYINTRIRGRLMSVLVQSANSNFWRLGRIRYRAAPAGRR